MELLEGIIKMSILIPTFLTAKQIVIFEWAATFLWNYYDYANSDLFTSDFLENYTTVWIVIGVIALYHLLFPITYPLTAVILLILSIVLGFAVIQSGFEFLFN